MISRGGPRKDIMFPIESVTFHKEELDRVMDVLIDNIRRSMVDFGRTAKFKLDLQIQVVHKQNKKGRKSWPLKKPLIRTPRKIGTNAGEPST